MSLMSLQNLQHLFVLVGPLSLECPHHWRMLRRDAVLYGGNMTTAEKCGVMVPWLRWTELIREEEEERQDVGQGPTRAEGMGQWLQ